MVFIIIDKMESRLLSSLFSVWQSEAAKQKAALVSRSKLKGSYRSLFCLSTLEGSVL